jgi:hypothetical protein
VANVAPFQIIAGPAKVYVAPTGTAFPAVSVPSTSLDTGGTWSPLGMTDGGVKVMHPQTIVELRTDQVTSVVKAVRSEESLEITFSIAELTLDKYAVALNSLATSGVTSNANDKTVNLYRGGSQVQTMALVVRGEHLSPYGDFNLQYEVPVVFEAGAPESDFTRDNKALLALTFHVEVDPNRLNDAASFGVLRAGTS